MDTTKNENAKAPNKEKEALQNAVYFRGQILTDNAAVCRELNNSNILVYVQCTPELRFPLNIRSGLPENGTLTVLGAQYSANPVWSERKRRITVIVDMVDKGKYQCNVEIEGVTYSFAPNEVIALEGAYPNETLPFEAYSKYCIAFEKVEGRYFVGDTHALVFAWRFLEQNISDIAQWDVRLQHYTLTTTVDFYRMVIKAIYADIMDGTSLFKGVSNVVDRRFYAEKLAKRMYSINKDVNSGKVGRCNVTLESVSLNKELKAEACIIEKMQNDMMAAGIYVKKTLAGTTFTNVRQIYITKDVELALDAVGVSITTTFFNGEGRIEIRANANHPRVDALAQSCNELRAYIETAKAAVSAIPKKQSVWRQFSRWVTRKRGNC